MHETGIPWNDPSGDVLRGWLGMDRDEFYDVSRIAIVPIGLCYPGTVDGADLPPPRQCAPLWQPRFRAALPGHRLDAARRPVRAEVLARQRMTKVHSRSGVRASATTCPSFSLLPHPSWRNKGWLKRNPWFEADVIPALRRRVKACMRRV